MLKRIISMIVLVAMVLCCGTFPVTVGATDSVAPDFTYFQDFENTAVGETGLSFGGNGTRSIVTDNGTSKLLLEGGGAAMDVYNTVEYTFPQAVKTGVIETSLKSSFDVYSGVQAFLAVLNGTADKPMISVLSGDWTYYTNQATGVGGQAAPAINPTTGMYHLRTVIYRENEADSWTANLYDDAGDEPKLMYATTISAATHSSITGVRLANNWPLSTVQNVMMDDIRIDYYDEVSDFFPAEKYTGYSQDFENTTVEESGLIFESYDGNGRKSIVTDNGTKKLLLEGGGAATTNDVYYYFPEIIKTGAIETSLKTSFDVNAGIQAFLAVLNGASARPMVSAYGTWTSYVTEAGEANMPAPTLNSTTNMYHLRTVVYRETEADNWTASLYDDAGDEPRLMYSTTIPAATYPQITGIKLANNWPMAAVQNVMFDDIVINYYEDVSAFLPGEPEPEPEPEEPVGFKGFAQTFENTTVEESQLTFDGNGDISIIADNGTNKLLLDGGTPPDRYSVVDYNFPEEIKTGVIQTSIKASFEDINAGAHAFLGVLNGMANRGMLSAYTNWTYYTTDAGVGNMPAPTLNEETNMYHFRTVVYRDNAARNWTASFYDDGGATPRLLYTTTISAATHPAVTGVRIANTWPMAASQKVLIDDIKVDYYSDVTDFFPVSSFTEYSQDFENTSLNEAGLVYGANGTKSIVSDNGTNKLLLEGGTPDIYNEVYYNLPQEVETGLIETSFKTSFDVNAGIQAFLAVMNGANAKPMISAYGTWTYYNTDAGEGGMPAPTLNSTTNMYHLRTVVYRDNVVSNWTASLYDDGGDAPKLLYSTTISAQTHSAITGIKLANNWPMAATQNVMIDDIEVKYFKAHHNPLRFSNLMASRGENFVTIKVDAQSVDLEEIPVTVVVAAYADNETRMTAVNFDTATTNADGSATTLEVTLNGVAQDDTLKVIFIDDLTTLKPLGSAEVISPAIFR